MVILMTYLRFMRITMKGFQLPKLSKECFGIIHESFTSHQNTLKVKIMFLHGNYYSEFCIDSEKEA